MVPPVQLFIALVVGVLFSPLLLGIFFFLLPFALFLLVLVVAVSVFAHFKLGFTYWDAYMLSGMILPKIQQTRAAKNNILTDGYW